MSQSLNLDAKISGFTLIDMADAPDESGTAYLFLHEKSKAKLLYLQNDDNNKSFTIGFKTPPKDNSGVFHILEHSVLQGGSKHFPIKDPFTELRKTSMLTFINACTGADSTFYPVSSTNEKDLQNLIAVYLDAVFYPNIYDNPAIFLQEGRHFDLHRNSNGEFNLLCSGVVYNEMKGALKDPFTILLNKSNEVLFPDTHLSWVSGGKPDAIQGLSYDDFKDAHRRHYCIDNSFMFLYGNLDIENFLKFINDKYLTLIISENRPESCVNDSLFQSAVQKNNIECYAEIEDMEAMACLALVVNGLSYKEKLAMQILSIAIGGSRGCPLRKAFLDAGLANDVNILFYPQNQGVFYLFCQGINLQASKDEFMKVLREELKRLSADGIPEKCISAALTSELIQLRMGSNDSNDGFRIASSCIPFWLNSDDNPLDYFSDSVLINQFKENSKEGYFEKLISSKLLECKHYASVFLLPGKDYSNEEENNALEKHYKLLKDAGNLSEIEQESRITSEFQNMKNSKENLEFLPRVSVCDLAHQGQSLSFSWGNDNGGVPYIVHKLDTRDMLYISLFYDVSSLSLKDCIHLNLLCSLYGKLETTKHSSLDLELLQGEKIADFSVGHSYTNSLLDQGKVVSVLEIKIVFPKEELNDAIGLLFEITQDTVFEDKNKIAMIFNSQRNSLKLGIISNPLVILKAKTLSYYKEKDALNYQSLIGVYELLNKLECDDLSQFGNVIDYLKLLHSKIKDMPYRCQSFAGPNELFNNYLNVVNENCGNKANKTNSLPDFNIFNDVKLSEKNEAFVMPADVAYISASCKFNYSNINKKQLAKKLGIWSVASKIISLDYLWNEVRVKIGAYGVDFKVNNDGIASFTAFRSPDIDKCIEVFKRAGKWLSECNLSKDELDGYIIRTISNIDKPLKPEGLISKHLSAIRKDFDDDYFEEKRKAIFEVSISEINDCGKELLSMMNDLKICVAANSEMINGSSHDFSINTTFEV